MQHKYSDSFTYNYVLPMCAAIWSVSNKQCFAFNIQVLVRFWANHHLLDLIERPQWRVVKNRSRSYVERVISELKDARSDTPVVSVRKISNGIGVERIFPVHSPMLESITVVRRGIVRRAKLFYLRGVTGKSARIKEKRTRLVVPETVAPAEPAAPAAE